MMSAMHGDEKKLKEAYDWIINGHLEDYLEDKIPVDAEILKE